MLNEPTKHWLRDLETHRFPRTVPFKRLGWKLKASASYLRARVRGRTRTLDSLTIVDWRERNDPLISAYGCQ